MSTAPQSDSSSSNMRRRMPPALHPWWLTLLLLLPAATLASGWTNNHQQHIGQGLLPGNQIHKRGGPGVYKWRRERYGRVRKGADVDWEGRDKVEDCMKIVADPGRFYYRSPGGEAAGNACGVYVVAPADQLVRIDIEAVEVTCGEGLVVFFDGWEMNRSVFPNSQDHHLPLKQRSTNMCTRKGEASKGRRFLSSQNAALIQYRVPQQGEGFAFTVSFINNPEPCNILMSAVEGVFTLKSRSMHGQRNCSLTTLLFPANFEIVGFDVANNEKSCCSSGSDYVEFGGSASLDSGSLQAKETACGCDKDRIRGNSLTVLCESASVRLVSSGQSSSNSVSVYARAADEQDLVGGGPGNILICPAFMKK